MDSLHPATPLQRVWRGYRTRRRLRRARDRFSAIFASLEPVASSRCVWPGEARNRLCRPRVAAPASCVAAATPLYTVLTAAATGIGVQDQTVVTADTAASAAAAGAATTAAAAAAAGGGVATAANAGANAGEATRRSNTVGSPGRANAHDAEERSSFDHDREYDRRRNGGQAPVTPPATAAPVALMVGRPASELERELQWAKQALAHRKAFLRDHQQGP